MNQLFENIYKKSLKESNLDEIKLELKFSEGIDGRDNFYLVKDGQYLQLGADDIGDLIRFFGRDFPCDLIYGDGYDWGKEKRDTQLGNVRSFMRSMKGE